MVQATSRITCCWLTGSSPRAYSTDQGSPRPIASVLGETHGNAVSPALGHTQLSGMIAQDMRLRGGLLMMNMSHNGGHRTRSELFCAYIGYKVGNRRGFRHRRICHDREPFPSRRRDPVSRPAASRRGYSAEWRHPASNGEVFTTVIRGRARCWPKCVRMQADDVDRAVRPRPTRLHPLGPDCRRTSARALAPPTGRRSRTALRDDWRSWKPLDCGKVYAQAEGDVQNFVDTTRYFADMALHVEHRSTLAVAAVTRRGPCGSRGARAGSSFPGISRSCWPAGESHLPWPPATRS